MTSVASISDSALAIMSKTPNVLNKADSGRGYHKVASGMALNTVKQHESESDITLFGANFCPFVQRVWAAFELLGIPYQVSSLFCMKIDQELW